MGPGAGAPRSRLARSVVRYLTGAAEHTFAELKAVGRDGDLDILDVDLEIEVVQRRKVKILPDEPVRLVFMTDDDSWAPRVLSRRADFPGGQVHTNLDREVDGLCLCIWEENWADLASSLTGQELIERIRSWFSSMADGSLHDPDQSLEPLIPSTSNTLIIPANDTSGPWHIVRATKVRGQFALTMSREPQHTLDASTGFAVFCPQLPSQVHRALAAPPRDLEALQSLCLSLDYDLVRNLSDWLRRPEQLAGAAQRLPLLILVIPKRRELSGNDEVAEVWAYTLSETVAELGERMSITLTEQGTTTIRLLSADIAVDLGAIHLDRWRVVQRLDRVTARRFAGALISRDANLVAIGAGAIGSNVAMIATRTGIGPWTIIDDDFLLPHNIVRQVQRDSGLGFAKALVLGVELDSVLSVDGNTAVVADVLSPGEELANIRVALEKAELVVDFSASPSVVGWLADQSISHAASSFFGPDGSDLVLLAEGEGRAVFIDEIEAQYFLAVASDPLLKGHLGAARLDKIRYANACQDLSRPLPPWQVMTLCGLAAGRLPVIIESNGPSACIWRLDTQSGAVLPVALHVHNTHRFSSETMRVSLSQNVVDTIRGLRTQAGNNETGGVLVGTFDLVRNIMHVVHALPAPPDSRQAPTYFIRGIRELKPCIENLAEASAGRLHYIGEWHSHPDRVPARPSQDDEGVYAHLHNHLDPVGSPYVMAICGQRDTWFRAGWQERGILEGIVEYAS
ncbi:Mov34/MPN/PAD-1 family protein [Pseudomonas monsensis]